MAEDQRQSDKSPRKCKYTPHSLWVKFTTAYINLISQCFARLSSVIARRPCTTIIICCVFVGFTSVGFYWMKVENRAEKLFIPQDSRAVRDMEIAEKNFPMDSRMEAVIFVPKQPSVSALSKECLRDVLAVHLQIINTKPYRELCTSKTFKNSPPFCLFLNPLELLQFNESEFSNATSKFEAALRNKTLIMRNGRPFWLNIEMVFGGLEIDKASGEIVNIKAIQTLYFMKTGDDNDQGIMDWEKEVLDKIRELGDNLKCMNVYISAQRSLDDAIGKSTVADITFISVTYTLMISFACIMLGKFRNPLTGHSLLANIGIFSVFLGILAGFGFTMLVQTPFVSIVGALPFLVVGIGIDDMFIIIDELDRVGPQLSVVETVTVVMAKSGPTITMTTMTDLVAFAVSTWSQLPAIQYFCLYAALAIFFAYLMIITFFVAMMTFDVRRVKAGRRDCFPFCRVPPPKEGAPAWDVPQTQPVNKALSTWGKVLMRREAKCIVVIISLALFGSGIYGALNMSENFDPKLLAKDGSPYLLFSEAKENFFPLKIAVSIIIDEKVDYTSVKIQQEIRQLSDIVSQNVFYENKTLSWMIAFNLFSNKMPSLKTEGKNFIPALKTFLSIPEFSHFNADLQFSNDGQSLEASRIFCYMKTSLNSIGHRDGMVTLREDIENKTPLPAYPISKPFVYFEQYAITFKATVRNLIIASGAILLITSPFLVDPCVTILVFLGFVALIFELFGLMYIWGVSLHGVSMINLIMAIGFAVDYSAHIAHAYVKSTKNTTDERVIEALRTLGASVIMGGASTFIGMVMLAFTSSEIFRIFFKMFFGIVFLGLLHGLCFLPVYLSIFCRSAPLKQEQPNSSIQENPDDAQDPSDNEDDAVAFVGEQGNTSASRFLPRVPEESLETGKDKTAPTNQNGFCVEDGHVDGSKTPLLVPSLPSAERDTPL